jgi:hypothetical protein
MKEKIDNDYRKALVELGEDEDVELNGGAAEEQAADMERGARKKQST